MSESHQQHTDADIAHRLSVQHEQNSSAKTGVGTPIYMAPEIIYGGNRYDAKASPGTWNACELPSRQLPVGTCCVVSMMLHRLHLHSLLR